MDTKTFLETVLGDSGYYCVWANRLSDERIVQKFYESIDAAIHAANDLDNNGFDAYFALGTFNVAGSRKGDNVKQVRAFFLDLDCGEAKHAENKGYRTQADALSALRVFCKKLKLPRPTVVNSGRGIHVYWPLTEPVSRETWLPVANRFKVLCQREKMIIDPVVPADAARVLRVPLTHNHKDDPPTQVHVVGSPAEPVTFDEFKEALLAGEEPAAAFKKPTKYTPQEADAMMQALTGSYTNRFKTIMLKTAKGDGCAQLADVVMNQANMSEPMWRAGLSIAKFCIDGGKAIHRISEKYPNYTPQATEDKASLIKGPYLCERFDEYTPGVCPDCKHWTKIKSPIVLGREVMEAEESDNVVTQTPAGIPAATPITYVIPKYPYPFFRGKNGGVFRHTKDEDGEPAEKLIYINDLYVVRRLKDAEVGEAVVMRLHLPRDGVREFTMPLTAVGSKDEFRKYIAAQGVAVLHVADLMEYTMRWVNELQLTVEADEAQRQFGWVDEEGTAFALGNMMVYADRVEINSPSSATIDLFPIFETRGTFDGWKETIRFYNRDGMEAHQFMVGLSFGSVLMHFQPLNAAAFHLYSEETGLGKTTGMLSGASVWGDPDLLLMQDRDTFNSKMNRAEVYKNIIGYMDELTNTKPQDLSDWAYQLPSGLQRNRMGPKGNVERRRGKPWKMLFGTTGNTSMLERIALYKALPKAEAQRILECRAQRVYFASKEETDKFIAATKNHYGHAGVVYVQYLMNNLDAAKELCEAVQRRLDEAAGLTAENRFWSALASRTIAGLTLAKRAGLIDWKIGPVANWIVNLMKESKDASKNLATDVESVLTEYLAEHYNSILRIKSTDDARKGVTGIDHLIQPEAYPRGNNLVARYEYDVKRMYLLPKPLKAWCGKQQINYAGLVDGLKNGRTKGTKVKLRLTRGTHVAMPPTDTIAIDCAGFMTDETEQVMATAATLFQKQSEE